MTIEIERMEVLGVDVSDLGGAKALFNKLFGIEFTSVVLGGPLISASPVPLEEGETVSDPQPSVQGAPTPLAIDRTGFLELIQAADGREPDRMRNIHFKVSNIEAATAEMQANGIRIIDNLRCGGLREVVFHPDDLYGVRLCFVEYSEPSIIEAMTRDMPSFVEREA